MHSFMESVFRHGFCPSRLCRQVHERIGVDWRVNVYTNDSPVKKCEDHRPFCFPVSEKLEQIPQYRLTLASKELVAIDLVSWVNWRPAILPEQFDIVEAWLHANLRVSNDDELATCFAANRGDNSKKDFVLFGE